MKSPEDPQVLDNSLQVLTEVRNGVVPMMVHGVIEYKEKHGFNSLLTVTSNYFLDWFCINCISFHLCISQHTLLFGGNTKPAHPEHTGNMNPTCNVANRVKDV